MLKRVLIIVLLCFSTMAFAHVRRSIVNELPSKPTSRVMDLANLLTPTEKNALEAQLHDLNVNARGTDVEILTLNNLGNEPIENVSLAVARKWGLGQKKLSNGLLIVVSREPRRYRIEVGYGLEGVLPDGYVGNAGRTLLTPNFKTGNYYRGLSALVADLQVQIDKGYAGKLARSSVNANLSVWQALLGAAIFMLITMALVYYASRRAKLNGNALDGTSTVNSAANGLLSGMIAGAVINELSHGSTSGFGGGSSFDDIGGGGGFGGGGASGDF